MNKKDVCEFKEKEVNSQILSNEDDILNTADKISKSKVLNSMYLKMY